MKLIKKRECVECKKTFEIPYKYQDVIACHICAEKCMMKITKQENSHPEIWEYALFSCSGNIRSCGKYLWKIDRSLTPYHCLSLVSERSYDEWGKVRTNQYEFVRKYPWDKEWFIILREGQRRLDEQNKIAWVEQKLQKFIPIDN